MSKNYIKLDGTIYREQEWSQDDLENFIDEILEIVEKYNGQAALGYCRKSEDELDDEIKYEMEIYMNYQESIKDYIKTRKKRRQDS